MKKLFFLLLLSVTVLCSAQSVAPMEQPAVQVTNASPPKAAIVYKQIVGKIVKVKDGDTVVVLDSLKNKTTIRLAGIDAPEKAQPFGKVAKQFTIDQVALKDVVITIETKDKYGRTVGWIRYNEKTNLSEELLKAGLAWHYQKYDTSDYLQSLEDAAKKNKVGLWVDPNPIRPEDWRGGKR